MQELRGAILAALGLALGVVLSSLAEAQEVLPAPPAPFKGQIGLSAKDSKSDFPQPVQARGRTEFTYYRSIARIAEGAAPDVKNKSFRITAEVITSKGDEQGVVLTQGGLSAGYALMFKDGKPLFNYNVANVVHFNIAANDPLAPGKHTVVFDVKYDGGGLVRAHAG